MIGLLLTAASVWLRPAAAQDAQPDPQGAPQVFIETVANQALARIRADGSVRAGDRARINRAVDELILPYVDFEKTTRLAAGRHWRNATPEQRQQLAEAFRGTLIRTYSGALTQVDNQTAIQMLPFRGDADAKDVVVSSQFIQGTRPLARVDYRLEKTPDGWKVYDLNVEGIWLIQNYRNQFNQQIQQNGIDGLIQALNTQNSQTSQ
ncbi:MAG: ABC transporter substrate-binding protein [Corticimicrobacter sp.]|uniref:MlaC/ttg2D family ABC transporter substrate-binding protein n=1 Tax=Corticimicrobacter sp. TaxID=2678536 RepID=UPI0032DA42DD